MANEKPEIIKLGELVTKNAIRVEADVPGAADVGFFGIVLAPDSDLTAVKLKNAIERAEKGAFMDIQLDKFRTDDLSYTTLGTWIGDQGLALALIGLGNLLELWDIVMPQTVGITDEALVQRMMGMGFLMLHVPETSILSS